MIRAGNHHLVQARVAHPAEDAVHPLVAEIPDVKKETACRERSLPRRMNRLGRLRDRLRGPASSERAPGGDAGGHLQQPPA
jgi:hypothetical protein